MDVIGRLAAPVDHVAPCIGPRAGQAGVRETGALSVWERPTRVALTGFTLGGAGVVAGFADAVVVAGTAAGVVLGVVGTTQMGVWLRRELRDVPDPGRR